MFNLQMMKNGQWTMIRQFQDQEEAKSELIKYRTVMGNTYRIAWKG